MTFVNSQNLENKIDQLIVLMAAQAVSTMESTIEKIIYLDKIGLDKNQIAKACDTSPNYVSVQLSLAKKKNKGVKK